MSHSRPGRFNVCLLWPIVCFGLLGGVVCSTAAAESPVDFAQDVRPLLSDTCYHCHGPDKKGRDSELRLDTRDGAFADLGGYRAIEPGDASKSELLRRITSDDPELHMPPVDSGRKLTAGQIDLLRRWIEEGARWEEHWSFVAPQAAPPPDVKDAAWPRGAIDRFVAARLDREGMAHALEADKPTLLRRVTLDLTGLPPTLAELDAFLADDSPDAYEKVVDRLLASPRFGEHMAVAWLDAARYGDTNGYQQDRTRTMWPWRDWVVEALNNNMPFDQFTIEQLAGDLLPGATVDQRLASGFHRNHPLNGEGGRIAEESRVEYVFDRVDTTATVWLGLTAGCARCHDHKYDPLTRVDYYQLYAFFNSIDEVGGVDAGGNAKPVMKAPTRQQAAQRRELQTQIAGLEKRLAEPADVQAFAAWQDELRASLKKSQPDRPWQAVDVVELQSQAGQTLQLQDDGSIFVSGKNPDNDTYTIVFRTRERNLRALRLEALTHESFTNGGIARSDSGNFVLTEIRLAQRSGDGPEEPIALADAAADFEQQGFPVGASFDGNAQTGWAVYNPPNMRINRAARFTLAKPVAVGEGATFALTLAHDSIHKAHNLGRFRISVSSQEKPPLKDEPQLPPAIVVAALDTPPADRTPQQTRALVDLYQQTAPTAAPLRNELEAARKQLSKLEGEFPEVMVMAERASPRETFVLKVGQYDQPDKSLPVSPNVPACLPSLEGDGPADRLALARWLVDGRHPLTARVTVNRIWQHYFGVGFVKTPEDFGSQGEPPTHPQLLDWLAVEFVKSGWDMKHLHRLIVTSAVYRQSSHVTPALAARDPQNVLLARGPRFRLSAFALRDQALALSGLLVEQMGGPPVQPYQPDGVWQDFSLGKIKYEQDHGEKLYRRSLYTFWRRSVGPTMLFDVSDRLVCNVRPRLTNTPLHALTMLNDVTYVEAARKFGERMVTEGGDLPAERLAWGFRLATARHPQAAELDVLERSLTRARTKFTADAAAAKALLGVGESPHNERLPPAELAAYATVAEVIMNLDEVVTKE